MTVSSLFRSGPIHPGPRPVSAGASSEGSSTCTPEIRDRIVELRSQAAKERGAAVAFLGFGLFLGGVGYFVRGLGPALGAGGFPVVGAALAYALSRQHEGEAQALQDGYHC